MFYAIGDAVLTAVDNAQKLRALHGETPPEQAKPSTTVDRLVERLLELER